MTFVLVLVLELRFVYPALFQVWEGFRFIWYLVADVIDCNIYFIAYKYICSSFPAWEGFGIICYLMADVIHFNIYFIV